jgi:hypothetical protein
MPELIVGLDHTAIACAAQRNLDFAPNCWPRFLSRTVKFDGHPSVPILAMTSSLELGEGN